MVQGYTIDVIHNSFRNDLNKLYKKHFRHNLIARCTFTQFEH